MNKVTTLVILSALLLTFQNCTQMDFAAQVANEKIDQSSQSPEEVDNTSEPEVPVEKDPVVPINQKVTIYGTVKDVWGEYGGVVQNSWLATGPIANVTIILKRGDYLNPNTRNSPSVAEYTTDSSGRFEFSNLDLDNYVIYWKVPSDKYYHEPDYKAVATVKSFSAQNNFSYNISQSIWIHRKGISYNCVYEDYTPMSNLVWKYYKTAAAYSNVKVDQVVYQTGHTDSKGSLHIDTTLLSLDNGKGGLLELEDSTGKVVGRSSFKEFNHVALVGGGRCANGL